MTDPISVNVMDCGAMGDGITDDTKAFRKAIRCARKAVIVPSGRYRINETLLIGRKRVKGK